MDKPRELLSPADDTASRTLANIQTATTRVKEILTDGVAKGLSDEEITASLNSEIASECRKIGNAELREQTRKALVTAAKKWHYELVMTYKTLDNNLASQAQKQPLNIDINDLLKKTPFEKMAEFRKILDDGTSPGIPVIKDYQRSVKIAIKAMSAEPPKVVTVKNGRSYVMPVRLRAEMAARYAAAVENLQTLINNGVLFCWISSHPNCSPRCAEYQGKLYSLFSGKAVFDGEEYGEHGTIDGIPYRPINEALSGKNGDGNGCISGYNCRHRAIEYERGSKPPQDFSEAEMKREYAVDKEQRNFENKIRQLKTEERQLRACGMEKEASAVRKQWRALTVDYKIYSIEHNRAFYPYRYVINEAEVEGITDGQLVDENIEQKLIDKHGILPVTSLSQTTFNMLSEKFELKSKRVIITNQQFKKHIAKGANTHDDIYYKVKNYLADIINNPDYIFKDDKHEDTIICVSEEHKTQIVVKLNTINRNLDNTIITIFGCGEDTLIRMKKKKEILYKKN